MRSSSSLTARKKSCWCSHRLFVLRGNRRRAREFTIYANKFTIFELPLGGHLDVIWTIFEPPLVGHLDVIWIFKHSNFSFTHQFQHTGPRREQHCCTFSTQEQFSSTIFKISSLDDDIPTNPPINPRTIAFRKPTYPRQSAHLPKTENETTSVLLGDQRLLPKTNVCCPPPKTKTNVLLSCQRHSQ